MSENVYIKIPQCIEVNKPEVLLKDFITVFTSEEKMKQSILNIPFHKFEEGKKGKLVVSVLKVIELITEKFPDVTVDNLGESDFILEYAPEDKHEKIKEWIFTFLICMVAFFGGGYAIMTYDTDVGLKELFLNLSMMITGNASTGIIYIIVAYAIGLTAGMILFFNHFGSKRMSSDPSPLEIQMRLYENDIGTTIIKDTSRRGESIEIKE